jgi:X-X-X-Leu-X-X-Gly heptad repeat protein
LQVDIRHARICFTGANATGIAKVGMPQAKAGMSQAKAGMPQAKAGMSQARVQGATLGPMRRVGAGIGKMHMEVKNGRC